MGQQLYVGLEKSYGSVRWEVLYSILTEFGISMKLTRMIKMYLNETCFKINIGKHLCDECTIQNGLK